MLQDLRAALKAKRADDTIRGFARELIDDKGLPIAYLVHKVNETVGVEEGERLEILVRGRHAVEKSKAERAKADGGLLGLVRKFLR